MGTNWAVYAADPTVGDPTTTGKINFDQWFHDTQSVNMTTGLHHASSSIRRTDGLWTFDNEGKPFFPIDGQLLGNFEWKDAASGVGLTTIILTLELHSKFKYSPGMQFTFVGDDDVWVYINNTLVVDLEGIHTSDTGVAVLDNLGLTPGRPISSTSSGPSGRIVDSNFRVDTSIEFIDCGIDVPR